VPPAVEPSVQAWLTAPVSPLWPAESAQSQDKLPPVRGETVFRPRCSAGYNAEDVVFEALLWVVSDQGLRGATEALEPLCPFGAIASHPPPPGS
jgi:hypothetical protein